jgi:hypothetical protein
MPRTQAGVELEAENARLRAVVAEQNELLREALLAANHGWARVDTLTARTKRLLRLAKYWHRLAPKPPLPDHIKEVMMARYAVLGGRQRGKGMGAAEQVAEEFDVSVATVNRIIPEFKDRMFTNKAEAERIVQRYWRRFGE